MLDSPLIPVEVLKETTLAEITSSDGKCIKPDYFLLHLILAKKKMHQQLDPNTWPRYIKPDAGTWLLWQDT
eukprot:6180195-Ditylum_brightwellii.AAC.1